MLLEADGLRLFATIKCDALAVFADAHHAETEVRFIALLVKVEPDELSPDKMGKAGTKPGVDEREPEHVAVNYKLCAADGNGQYAREVP